MSGVCFKFPEKAKLVLKCSSSRGLDFFRVLFKNSRHAPHKRPVKKPAQISKKELSILVCIFDVGKVDQVLRPGHLLNPF